MYTTPAFQAEEEFKKAVLTGRQGDFWEMRRNILIKTFLSHPLNYPQGGSQLQIKTISTNEFHTKKNTASKSKMKNKTIGHLEKQPSSKALFIKSKAFCCSAKCDKSV